MPELSWSVARAWNESLINRAERPLKVRDYCWASEIGGSMIDRYLKMNAVPATNAPNARALRKFEAGNLFEWILEFVLKRAGVLLDTQEWINYQYPGLLRVTGKMDFLAGGQPDWERARQEVQTIGLPDAINRASLAIVDNLSDTFGDDTLKTIIIECKSVSSFMMDRYEATGTANPNHRCQLFHYLKGKELSEGHVVYICKDDCRMLELGVFNPSPVEDEYKADLERMTAYIRNGEQPPKEQEIQFDKDAQRGLGGFSANWKIEYSNYLTHLYGYKQPMDYRDAVDKTIGQMNRVYKRCVTGANMTAKNLLAITAAKNHFPNWDELVEAGKKAAEKNPEIAKESDEPESD